MAYTKLTLPDRPLKMEPGAIAAPRGSLFAIVLFLALSGFFVWWQGPGLWRDWQISLNPISADSSDVLNGECRTSKGFFTDCKAHVVYDHNGQHYESDIKLMFVDIKSGDYWVDVVISADKPHLATISLGLEKLWNRVIMFALFTFGFAFAALFMIWTRLRAARASYALSQPGKLTLTPVEITNMNTVRGVTQVNYQDKERSKRVLAANFRNGEDPLMVWDAQGNGYGLAVRSPNTPLAGLLDRGLTRVNLTNEERRDAQALLAAEETAHFGQPQKDDTPAKRRGIGFLRNLLTTLGIILFFVLAALGWWLWYVTNGSSQYDKIGMEINAIMPDGINAWACGKLEERFGDQNAPYGCTGPDHVSWK